MKVEIWLFTILVAFFVVVGTIYGTFTDWGEPVGAVALYLCAGLAAMIALFLWWTARKLEPRPEDDPLGEIDQIEGEFGFFPPHSWWPLAVAAAAAVVFLGLAIGWWMVIIGAPLLAIATVGWTFEYFRGTNAV